MNLEVIRESLKKLEKEIIAFAKQLPGFNGLISIKDPSYGLENR